MSHRHFIYIISILTTFMIFLTLLRATRPSSSNPTPTPPITYLDQDIISPQALSSIPASKLADIMIIQESLDPNGNPISYSSHPTTIGDDNLYFTDTYQAYLFGIIPLTFTRTDHYHISTGAYQVYFSPSYITTLAQMGFIDLASAYRLP